ncbi:MAG: quinohemoprotein amine dehydrogenase subunit alpha [Gammaproteobacteria bacterium]|nr:quinohemoprotein amine dehydrogenase subunit alpha [Gammaproteobacteria bacterium]
MKGSPASFFILSLALVVSSPAIADSRLLDSKCSSCHARVTGGGLERIKDQRKTPEGWDMTIVRMMLLHGVQVSGDERGALVKHLADTQGLTPQETAGWRYVLERRPNVFDHQPDDTIAQLCARCHTYARVALQRRTQDEWAKLTHFHLGQYPTAEYQAMGRDRNWWEIVSTEVPPMLAEAYPLDASAWQNWKSRAMPDLAGSWRVVGHQSGAGPYQGSMRIKREEGDNYSLELSLQFAGGASMSGSGRAILYSGHEWRASMDLNGKPILQVLALGEDGALEGRWFLEAQDAIGGDMRAVRNNGAANILSLSPAYLRAGETGRIAIHGVNLSGTVDLGAGVSIEGTLQQDPDTIVVEVRATANSGNGSRRVRVGSAAANDLFSVYGRVDSVRVEPAVAIARVGGGGSPIAAVPAQFDAVGYLNGPDGAAGTDDDMRIGVMPASWTTEPADDTARELQDTKYAGAINASGLFTPAEAGPNPERPFSTNNVGSLAIVAAVSDGGKTVSGSGHLVVTVQRWNDPPIR